MQFRKFENHFKNHQLITSQDIKNTFGYYNRRQLSEWVDKDWLISLRRGQYLLASQKDEIDQELLANEVKNSYISLEYALNRFNLIPEVTRKITSITTERGEEVKTPVGDFLYRRIQPQLFTGYELIDARVPGRKIKMALPTKALFDLIYLNPLSTAKDFEALRLSQDEFFNLFDQEKFIFWLESVKSPPLKTRLMNFIHFLKNNA